MKWNRLINIKHTVVTCYFKSGCRKLVWNNREECRRDLRGDQQRHTTRVTVTIQICSSRQENVGFRC